MTPAPKTALGEDLPVQDRPSGDRPDHLADHPGPRDLQLLGPPPRHPGHDGLARYHLHLFRLTEPGTDAVVQIGIPDDDAFEGDEPILPGWEIPIADYFTRPGAAARYEYDLGDSWEHEVTLEAVAPPQTGKRYPVCLAGERRCPPEDCGGVGGYEDLMALMRDPSHEEYESTLRWLGGRFEPEQFDPGEVKFDDPRKRWELAFGKTMQRRRRRRPSGRG